MSNIQPTEPYIYQPYGMQDKEFWKDRKIYAIGGIEPSIIKGISKELANIILREIKEGKNERT